MLSLSLSWLTALAAVILLFLQRLFKPPSTLCHIPRVPIWSVLFSYVSGEVEEQRIRRIFLPFALENNTPVILVWCFGEWMVHILDSKVGRTVMDNRRLRKQPPPAGMLFWRFTGRENIFFSEGEQWKKHSRIFRTALQRTAPMEQFSMLSRKLCSLIGDGGRVRWSDYSHRFTLDAVGTTVLGYDFEALDKPEGSFILQYHQVMTAISEPVYCFLPALERWVPRHAVRRDVDALVDRFRALLAAKRQDPGNDVITYMFEEPDMTDEEFRDNIVVLFMGGHDSTAGAISSLIFFLALYPKVQTQARAEVLSVVGSGVELTMEHFARMPYLRAVIYESMRLNNPANITLPRTADVPIQVGPYSLPPNTPIILNMSAILHHEDVWDDPFNFRPDRFMGDSHTEDSWLPFGLGPHQCPARNFALYEQRTLAATLLREFSWKLPVDSIHLNGIRNAFSPFSLSLPIDVDVAFTKL